MSAMIRSDYIHCATLDVYSILHVAEAAYFSKLQNVLKDYDFVLFELMASRDNIKQSRQLRSPVYSFASHQLCTSLGLKSQLSMNLTQPNWFVADLDIETVRALELHRYEEIKSKFRDSTIDGRTFSNQLLRNFQFTDQKFVSALRRLSWLSPCPELSCVLVDWARMQPSAGGITPLLVPILDHITAIFSLPTIPSIPVSGSTKLPTGEISRMISVIQDNLSQRLQSVKKLLFAQEIMSGLPDAGAWGGAARSDTTVRVVARNKECIRVLAALMAELSSTHRQRNSSAKDNSEVASNNTKIAILYGAYHIADLTNRLTEELHFIPDPSHPPTYLVAWEIPSPPSDCSENNSTADKAATTNTSTTMTSAPPRLRSSQIILLSAVAVVYLILGAVDWLALCTLLTHTVEHLAHLLLDLLTTFGHENSPEIQVYWKGNTQIRDELRQAVNRTLFTTSYAVLYVLRHHYLLKKISYNGIQWEKGLFADAI